MVATRNWFMTFRMITARWTPLSRRPPPVHDTTIGSGPPEPPPPIWRIGGSTKNASIAMIARAARAAFSYWRKTPKDPAMEPPVGCCLDGKTAEA